MLKHWSFLHSCSIDYIENVDLQHDKLSKWLLRSIKLIAQGFQRKKTMCESTHHICIPYNSLIGVLLQEVNDHFHFLRYDELRISFEQLHRVFLALFDICYKNPTCAIGHVEDLYSIFFHNTYINSSKLAV